MVAATKPEYPRRPPRPAEPAEIVYPDGDGEPIADDTLQYEWIVLLKENLEVMLPDFVAGDLLWYPVEGQPTVRAAPDVMVCLGRPKGYRGSYMQFREEGVPPTVVFEVLSPRNTLREMIRKSAFYTRHGAREFIVVDPEAEHGWAYLRADSGDTVEVSTVDGWTSPSLGIRFARGADGKLEVYRPDGTRFRSFTELEAQRRAADARADEAERRAEQEAQRAEQEAQRAERLAARLAALGIDPDAL